jgi:hypothetical protein
MPGEEVITEGHAVAHFIRDYWPVLLATIGFIVSILVVLKGRLPLMERRLEDAFDKIKRLENARYQPIADCAAIREDCQMHQSKFEDTFCRKLDNISSELRGIVTDADSKREETRTEITTMNQQLIELMTQMKTILARDRRQETADMVKLVVDQVFKQMKNGSTNKRIN